LILAIGHSARASFRWLKEAGLPMERKAFSMGVRVEHRQEWIDWALYGEMAGRLPPAEYSLSCRLDGGRGCYTFCMCPGGVVVPAASEAGGIAVNGMSYHARDGENANAAVAVSVLPGDFDGDDVLAGVEFQRTWERRAYDFSKTYRAPAQTFGDFLAKRPTGGFGAVRPSYPIGVAGADLGPLLPGFVAEGLRMGFQNFGRKVKGFDSADAVLTAPETRTSSPVRILRGDDLMSAGCAGLIPCGEGAGYAGGIMSAAVDGLRAADRVLHMYRPTKSI